MSAGHFGERREVITGNHVVPIRQIDSHEVEVIRGRIETQRNHAFVGCLQLRESQAPIDDGDLT